MKLLLSTLLAAICTAAIGWAELPVPREEVRHGEFQYSLEFDNRGVDGRPARPATAYLWIPPSAEKLRGVIVTQQNVGEQPFVEHPAVREVGAKNDLAIVWCCPPIDLRFQHEREKAVRLFEEVLRDLGAHSGYGEIGTVPWITFGHSSTTTFARNLAEARRGAHHRDPLGEGRNHAAGDRLDSGSLFGRTVSGVAAAGARLDSAWPVAPRSGDDSGGIADALAAGVVCRGLRRWPFRLHGALPRLSRALHRQGRPVPGRCGRQGPPDPRR